MDNVSAFGDFRNTCKHGHHDANVFLDNYFELVPRHLIQQVTKQVLNMLVLEDCLNSTYPS